MTRRIQTIEKKPLYNKQYNKCGFRVNVETFGIFKYICAGLKMQCNLVPHLSYCRPLHTSLKMNYLYLIVYSLIPEKAIFGRKDVASTLLSLSYSLIIISAQLWLEYYFKFRLINAYSFFGLFIISFVTCRMVYLEPIRLSKILCEYEKMSKLTLKLVGILFFLFVYFSFIATGIALTMLHK